MIPAGTYVKGKIAQVKRAGRIKGRAEILFNFTTMIFPTAIPSTCLEHWKTRQAPATAPSLTKKAQ